MNEPTTLTQAQREVCRHFCGKTPSRHDPVCSLIVGASPLCDCPVTHECDCPEWGHPSACDCGRT